MNNSHFSLKNKQLLEQKPLFNLAVKSYFKNPEINSNFGKDLLRAESVLFICDFEGKILLIGSPFSAIDCDFENPSKRSILDYIHPEDCYFVIEHLVALLQEKTESVVFEARFLCKKKQYKTTKWHVGYICGLFFFYPLFTTRPNLLPETPSVFQAAQIGKENVLTQNPHLFFWKMEIEKTLFEWDEIVNKQLNYCLSV